jgi:anti-sigma factor RsiW
MSCEEIEISILDYQQNQLSPGQRAEVETHLAGCAGCRTLAQRLHQLDGALSASIKVPALSADFDQRIWEQVQAAPAALAEAQRAERKRQLQAEFEAGLARISRESFTWSSLIRQLTSLAWATVAAFLAWGITRQLTWHLHAQILGGLSPDQMPWLVAGAVLLVVGLAETFPQEWRSLRVW